MDVLGYGVTQFISWEFPFSPILVSIPYNSKMYLYIYGTISTVQRQSYVNGVGFR